MDDRAARILIADDDTTFLQTTADLLSNAGYRCECVRDGLAAATLLSERDFELLIADIRMPGNENLELIREHPKIVGGLPVIVITGHPTVTSAVDSIHLAVWDYALKPLDFDDFLVKVHKAVSSYRAMQAVHRLTQRLEVWQTETALFKKSLAARPHLPAEETLQAFARLAYGHALDTLTDVQRLGISASADDVAAENCPYMRCARLNLCLHAIKDTVVVLERTKASFKSKELGALRSQLEQFLSDFGNVEQEK